MKTSNTKQGNSTRFPDSNMSAKLQEIVSRSNKVTQRLDKWSSGHLTKLKQTANPDAKKPGSPAARTHESKSPSKQGTALLNKDGYYIKTAGLGPDPFKKVDRLMKKLTTTDERLNLVGCCSSEREAAQQRQRLQSQKPISSSHHQTQQRSHQYDVVCVG